MQDSDVKKGMRVRVAHLSSTGGMMVKNKHLECRKEGVFGIVKDYVAGHGGDVWWVAHENSTDIGAYCFDEIEPAEDVQEVKKINSNAIEQLGIE